MSEYYMLLRPEIWDRNIPEPTPNPKCVSCKCYWKPDNDDMKASGLFYTSCRRCRKPKKTAGDIREKARGYAIMKREKRKAELLK